MINSLSLQDRPFPAIRSDAVSFGTSPKTVHVSQTSSGRIETGTPASGGGMDPDIPPIGTRRIQTVCWNPAADYIRGTFLALCPAAFSETDPSRPSR